MIGSELSQDPIEQQHTYLQEKYNQEAEALAMTKPRFMHKTSRGYAEGKGPSAVQNPKNYNQKLRRFMEDALDETEENPKEFPYMVENYFKDNLLKRYNLIRYLNAEIKRERTKNELKRKLLEDQKSKTEQRQLSKTLVTSFKECID